MTDPINLATIGFTESTAERFFGRLIEARVACVIDVRLHNSSQLAGFAKAKDLGFFLQAIGGIGYVHEPLLAPTEEMFTAYKKAKGDWSTYERRFLALMASRRIDERLNPDFFRSGCLLCSEGSRTTVTAVSSRTT